LGYLLALGLDGVQDDPKSFVGPRSSEHGTYRTVKARFGTNKTVKARFGTNETVKARFWH
jgi:hypothetical protein